MEERKSIGIFFTMKALQKITHYQKVDESFSNAVIRYIDTAANCSNELDTKLLTKLVPLFVKEKLSLKLVPEEVARIKELYAQSKQTKGAPTHE